MGPNLRFYPCNQGGLAAMKASFLIPSYSLHTNWELMSLSTDQRHVASPAVTLAPHRSVQCRCRRGSTAISDWDLIPLSLGLQIGEANQ